MKRSLIYVELKTGYGHSGPAWIGFAGYSKSGATVYFDGKAFKSLRGEGITANYYEVESDDEYWISGVKKNGQDRHWAGGGDIEIDETAIGPYLSAMGLSKLPRNILPTSLAPSEFTQELHESENEVFDGSDDTEIGRDPRNGRFHTLKKKEPSQLTAIEITELITTCDEMIDYVKAKKSRKTWRKYRGKLSELLNKSPQLN